MNDLEQSDEFRAYEVRRLILYPPAWQTLALQVPLQWTSIQLSKTAPNQISDTDHGVYTFVVQPGIASHPLCACLLYVGKASGKGGFRARYYSYVGEHGKDDSPRPLVNRMINKWYEHLWFCYAVVPTASVPNTEEELLKAYMPPYNTQFPAEISAAVRAF